ncbi:MAG: apolipoprotein N-acyltransferase [Salibacteraceae bacterium]|jgi:apolipoprotein N-acyltransferase
MTISKKIGLALSSGILLAAAWPSIGSATPLLFFALTPLFLLERSVYESQLKGEKSKLFPFIFLSLLVFNALTTWWVWNASPEGSIMAIVLNSLFLALIIQLAHFTRIKLGNFRGDLALIFFWIAWEYFHLDWDLSWTWLTLGNGLAGVPSLIQWYEYTGVFGGSLWILISNLFIVHWIVKAEQHESKPYKLPGVIFGIKWFFVLVIPIIISLVIWNNYEEMENPIEVVAVQPNIDPYNEKFGGMTSVDQVAKMFQLAESKITATTDFVIFPETAIPNGFDEEVFQDTEEYGIIIDFVNNHPNTQVIIGASTFVVFGPNEPISTTARTAQSGVKYDYCNTAISISNSTKPEFYHKSKMVPGVEKVPFPILLRPIQDQIFDLGGALGSLAGQETRTVFTSPSGKTAAPIICYESVYGEFVGDFINNGAEAIFIITNDGWWKNTPGYKQHALYGQIRAIEHRRSVARSANTGISCFIDQKGVTSQSTEWWVPDVIAAKINGNSTLTFYTKYGDILGRISLAFGILLLVMAVSRGLINKNK